jgi:uncharacterized protein (TIGR03435 family)
VLLHELAHLARYDDWMVLATRGLGALLALHPLSAIVLGRIEREREMACDDFVVARTGSARGYARSLAQLHDLRWSAGTRLLAPALLGGNSQLVERIELLLRRGRVFSARPSPADLGACALLLAVLLAAGGLVPGWIAIAQTKTELPTSFEVASIKPAEPNSQNHAFMVSTHGRLNVVNLPVEDLVLHAYGIDSNQLVGLPSWATSRLYTIEAEPPCDMAPFRKDQRWEAQRQMLQSLLADRFKLKVHRSTKQLPVYELVVTKGGPKLEPVSEAEYAAVGGVAREGHPLPGIQVGPESIIAWGQPVSSLVGPLSGVAGRLVVDKTGITGRYYIKLTWNPSSGGAGLDSGPTPEHGEPGGTPADANLSGPSIFTALQEQLGLKLRSAKGPVEVLVVDHVERPSEN